VYIQVHTRRSFLGAWLYLCAFAVHRSCEQVRLRPSVAPTRDGRRVGPDSVLLQLCRYSSVNPQHPALLHAAALQAVFTRTLWHTRKGSWLKAPCGDENHDPLACTVGIHQAPCASVFRAVLGDPSFAQP
jgi:hypothetical protein